MSTSERSSLRRILAASDLSEESDSALTAAAALARAASAELLVVHCIQPPVFPFWEGALSTSIRADWERNALTDLEWQVRRVLGDELPGLSLEVRIGEPASEISRIASDSGADIVVLGPHQPRIAFDDLLGTTADRIIRLCESPCLIANRPLSLPVTRVLFPVDFSEPSNHCVATGIELLAESVFSNREGSEDQPTVVELLFVSAFAASQPRLFAVEPKLGGLVERANACLPKDSSVKILPRILSAPLAVEGIRRAAESMDADLIVMGTHGYGMLGRTLIGSVASSTVRTLPRSILMVPPP